jgi:hypothetical protein
MTIVMGKPNFPLKDLYWVAGIVEGEGCFTIHREYIRVSVKMTDEDIIRRLHSVTGIGKVAGPHANGDLKPSWKWEVNVQKDASALMMTLYPIMGERRQEKIEECLAHWKSFAYRDPNICRRGHNKGGNRRCKRCDHLHGQKRAWDKVLGY